MRFTAIATYVFVAWMSRRLSNRLTITLLVATVVVDVFLVVADLFKLAPGLAFDSLKYVVKLDPFASFTYLAAFALLCLNTAAVAYVLIKYRPVLREASMTPALAGMVAISLAFLSANSLAEYKFGKWMGGPKLWGSVVEFDSAMNNSGLSKALAAPGAKPDVLFVMVEGLGAFDDPAHNAILTDILKDDRVKSRYKFSEGLSSYVGSTTGAESREFCGKWGDFRDYMTADSYDCLPSKLSAKGYETASYHAFTQEFFERGDWYPRIGFQNTNFIEQMAPDLETNPQPQCGLTWRGLCDRDVADRVEAFLAKPGDQAKFAYWLTLNSHMPIHADDVTPRLGCKDGGQFGDRTVCVMTEMWVEVFEKVRAMALNPELANLEIILIGDHHPPVWTRGGRALFTPGKVAWYRLSPRSRTIASE